MKIGLTNIVSCKIGSTQVNRVYIGSTLIWSYSAFDPDAQLFITNAAITDSTQQNAVNNLVINLKNYGIWSKMKALYPMVGGTASQHKFNLKNPLDTDAAFRLVFNGGWTHSSTGALPNGTNAFANTFLILDNQLGTDKPHISYYSITNANTATDQIDMGSFNGAVYCWVSAWYNGSGFSNILARNTSTSVLLNGGTTTDSRGLYQTNKILTVSKLQKNSSILDTKTDTAGNVSGWPIYIGSLNDSGNASNFTNRQTAFNAIGSGLTDTEAANYYTAVQIFQTSLNRNVGVAIVSDSDAQAFLNAAVIEDSTQASAVNTLVTDLKGYGIWTKMKALYPFVGGTASQHKFNLKNPLDSDAAFRLVFNGGITHSSTGVKGNGTNAYYQTFINVANTFSPATGGSMFTYIRNNISGGVDLGAYSTAVLRMNLVSRYSDNTFYAGGLSQSQYALSNTDSRGFYGVTREPNAPNFYSILNTNSYSLTAAYVEPSVNINGLALNVDNSGVNEYTAREQAFACIANGLTPAEAQNLRLANLTFQTTLSRNV